MSMAEHESPKTQLYYLVLAVVVGGVVLGLEVLAARTMAPSIGTGPIAWAALLAVALGTLAAGNLIGGVIAGRFSTESVVMWSFVIAAAALIVLSRIYRPLMIRAAGLPLFRGSLMAAILTQFIPMLVLGANTPVLLQAGETYVRKGMWHGLVLACGSAGGIAGALAMALSFLPSFGISRSYLLLGLVLAVSTIPLICRGRRWRTLVVVLVLLVAIVLCWCYSGHSQVVQSQHGAIEVRHGAGQSILLIDGLPQTGFPHYAERWEGLRHGYLLEVILLAPAKPRNALVIGLGAGYSYDARHRLRVGGDRFPCNRSSQERLRFHGQGNSGRRPLLSSEFRKEVGPDRRGRLHIRTTPGAHVHGRSDAIGKRASIGRWDSGFAIHRRQ